MIIKMKNFGSILDSHPYGLESYLGFRPVLLHERKPDEEIIVDFHGVMVLTPSYAAPFFGELIEQYPGKVTFAHTDNITVQRTLAFLAEGWPEGTYEER